MNIISYDIELTRKKKETEILDIIQSCIAEAYRADNNDNSIIESTWNELPYSEFITVFSAKHLLYSFTIENVKVFLFKKVTDGIVSLDDLSLTVFAISNKEINLILKSSYSKLSSLFQKSIKIVVIDGTQVNIYPFDTDKNDVVSPSFFLKAEYNTSIINLDTREWIKLIIFIIITCVFIVMYFTTPPEIINAKTNKLTPNNLKELYSALMSLGLGFVVIELITKLLVPKIIKRKYPVV
ncbi:MAG: hypothetical protein EOO42_10625, partial [Flavobacteriales bacterium]